jgi:hypothetical protein
MIKCGHCHQGHNSVADVRKCSQGTTLLRDREQDSLEALEAEMDRMVREGERAEDERLAAYKANRDAALASLSGAQTSLSISVANVRALLAERVVEPRYRVALESYLEGSTVTVHGLQTAMARLSALPRKGQPTGQPVTEPGLYRREGVVFYVQWNKAQTHLYAKEAKLGPDGKWEREYAPGAMRFLRDTDRMTVEQAEEFGRDHAWCAICGRYLTNPESIARGIGPICAGKV